MSFIHECLVQVFTSHLSSEQPVRQRQVQAALPAPGCYLLSATRLMMSLWYDPESTEYRKQSTEYRVQSTEHRKQSTEYRVQKTEYRVQSTEFRVQGTEYRVQSTEYRVQKTEYRVQSTEYRILPADSPASPALWQSYRNVAPRHKDVNWPSRASQSTGEWHFWEARPAWYNLTALSLYFSSHWQVHRPVCTQGRQRPHGHILGSAGHQPRAGHGGGEQVRWSPHGRVVEREREREREVRDGKISARVARRAVPVSAEGVKKALPAPAASPVQAVRWWRQDRLRHWSQQPVRQTAMNSKLVTSAATLLLLLCLVETGECHRVKVCEQPGKLICSHPRTITTSQLLWPPAKNSFAKNISDEISENISPPHHHRSSLEWRE